MRLVVAIAVGLLAGFAAGRLTVDEPPAETILETRVEHKATRVVTRAQGTEFAPALATGDAVLDELLAGREDVLRQILEDDQRRAEVGRVILLAAMLDPAMFDGLEELIRRDVLASQTLMTAAFAMYPVDPSAARKLLTVARFPGDLDEALAQMDRQFSVGGGRQGLEELLARPTVNMMTMYRPLTEMAWQDPEGTLFVLEHSGHAQQREFEQYVLRQWIERDAAAAVAWLQTSQREGLIRGALQPIAQYWVKADRAAAIAWQDELEGSQRYRYLQYLAVEIADQQPEAIGAFLAAQSESRNYEDLVRGAAVSMSRKDVSEALALVDGLARPAAESAYTAILPAYFREDADGALAWWERQPADRRESLRFQVAENLSRTDHERALAIAQGIAEDDSRAFAVAQVVMQLSFRDVSAASELLQEVPEGQHRERLVRQVVQRLSSDEEATLVGRRYDLSEDDVFNIRTNGR